MRDEGETLYQAIVIHHTCVHLIDLLSKVNDDAISRALILMRQTAGALGSAEPSEEAITARERMLLVIRFLSLLSGTDPGDDTSEPDNEPGTETDNETDTTGDNEHDQDPDRKRYQGSEEGDRRS